MSPPRTRARRGEGDRLRAELLDATEKLLFETGSTEAVSIRAVADRVGVTPPSIYRHFADKQTLLFEVCSAQFDQLHDRLQDVLADADTPDERLIACARAYVQFGLEFPEHYRYMFMEPIALTAEQYDVIVGDGSAFNTLVEVVGDVITQRDVEDDPFAIVVMLWASVHGIVSLRMTKPDFPWPPVDDVVQTMCTSHLRGTLGQE